MTARARTQRRRAGFAGDHDEPNTRRNRRDCRRRWSRPPLVPDARPRPLEHAHRFEPRVVVRRLRDLRPDPDDWSGHAPAARAGSPSKHSGLRRHDSRPQSVWLGSRRHDRWHSCGLPGSPADDDHRGARLLVDDWTERVRLQLGLLRNLALRGRRGRRVRMGDGLVDDRRDLARSRARQRRRPDAVRSRDRVLHRVAGVAVCRLARAGSLAGHVSAGRAAGAPDALDPPIDSGIGALGDGRREAARRTQATTERPDVWRVSRCSISSRIGASGARPSSCF